MSGQTSPDIVWENGVLKDEPTDVLKYWRDDLVAFLLGCSFSFEGALIEAGIPIRHIDSGCNVPMYITNIQCNPAGRLSGPMVVQHEARQTFSGRKGRLCTGRFRQFTERRYT